MKATKTAGRGRAGKQLNLRVSKGEQAKWKAQARKRGLALSAWVRVACNVFADRGGHWLEGDYARELPPVNEASDE